MYQEAMRCSDTNGWVEVVTEEYNNLHCKGVFKEVEVPPDMHVHEGWLVFTEKIRSTGEVTRKKVRVVAKGFTEVWGEDYQMVFPQPLVQSGDSKRHCMA